MRVLLFIAGFLIVAVVGPGCGTLSNKEPVFADLPPLTSETDNLAVDREKMRPGEVIMISFAQPDGKELPFNIKIRDDGTVTLLSNKVFIAAGKTTRELEKEFFNQYGPKLFPNTVIDPPARFCLR